MYLQSGIDAYHLEPCATWYHTSSSSTMISLFISYQWYHRYDMHHDLIVISQNYHMIHHKQYYDIIGWIRRWNTSTALNITPLLHWVVPSWIFPAESPCLRGHFPGKSESDTAGSHRFGIFSAAQHCWTSLVVRTTGHCTYLDRALVGLCHTSWPAVRVEYILYPYRQVSFIKVD